MGSSCVIPNLEGEMAADGKELLQSLGCSMIQPGNSKERQQLPSLTKQGVPWSGCSCSGGKSWSHSQDSLHIQAGWCCRSFRWCQHKGMERTPGAPAPPGCTPDPWAGKAGTGWKREIWAEKGNKRDGDLGWPPGWTREAGLVQLEQRSRSKS